MPDQYTFADPRTLHPAIQPPEQHQDEPGLQSRMTPVPDLGESTYRGTGRLAGRKALITAADSGIGGAVAIAFAREGADVTMSYLPVEQSDADHVIEQIEQAGRAAHPFPGDLTDGQYCRDLVDHAVERMGGLDIVVNVAGKQVVADEIGELPDEQFVETFATNVFAAFRIIKAAVPHLPPGSTIINTASLEAYTPAPMRVDYASTKGAINNLTKGLAQQLIEKGIRVNVVAPGPTWTALQVTDGVPTEELPEFGSETPLGRAGQPAEIAPAYVFLASPESSFVIGSTLAVTGGLPTP
jgi:NAD(P)-dependent dehydrogenase (short-subunit alcohol dehydrogenase family)